jgi:hypothetical protein
MANVEPKEKEDFDRIINFVDFEWTMYVSEKYRIRTITIMVLPQRVSASR